MFQVGVWRVAWNKYRVELDSGRRDGELPEISNEQELFQAGVMESCLKQVSCGTSFRQA